jgi:Tol biopolymer transport system component
MANSDRLARALADRYRIERELGTGGMATVYLAVDLKHHRKVALKVLREELTATVGAARFLREIEIAAQLQHPNILPLHESGEADGFLYYVMPYVEGQSLRQRLVREGELPIGESVRLLIEIVDALAYAHARGVVHRDMKPDNVMLSGRHALVTDFGVAKAVSDATDSLTITTAGVALGTPAYMAPEQATADPHIDHRADLYAVGVMAYEFLSGGPPFTGQTAQRVLAAHVTEQPEPVVKRRAEISAALDQVVMRCLAKRPADRWQSAGELLAQLETLATPSGGTRPTEARLGTVQKRKPWVPLLLAAAAAVAVIVAGTLWRTQRTPTLTFGRQIQLTSDPGLEVYPAISPDGKVIAYAAGTSARMRVYLRPVSGGRTLALSNDSSSVETQPAWSPDGEHLVFLARGRAYVASALGGEVRPVFAGGSAPVSAATWSPDGKEIGAIRGDSLFAYTTDGTHSRFIARGNELHSCEWSPTGAWIACVSGNPHYPEPGGFFANRSPSKIVLIAPSDGRMVNITDSTTFHQNPRWSSDGRQLFFVSNRDGPRDIYGVSIRSDGQPRGQPVKLTTGLGVQSFSFDASRRRIAYAVYHEQANLWSLPIPERPPVSIDGAVPLTAGSQVIELMRASPDGKWIYFDSDLRGNSDVYRIPTGGGEPQQLTTDPADDFAAVGSPDGTEFAFHSFRKGTRDVYVQRVGGGVAQALTATPAQECCPIWSPDGSTIAIADFSDSGGISLIRRDSMGRWGKPRHILPHGFLHWWSPDGKSLVVASGRTIRGSFQSERLEIVPVDSGHPVTVYAVSDTVNDPVIGDPRWSSDGTRIYFKSQDNLDRSSIWSLALPNGRPRLLVRFDDPARPSFRPNFTTEGKRFYFAINDRQSDIWVADIARK